MNEANYRDSGRTGGGELDMLCVTMSEKAGKCNGFKVSEYFVEFGT